MPNHLFMVKLHVFLMVSQRTWAEGFLKRACNFFLKGGCWSCIFAGSTFGRKAIRKEEIKTKPHAHSLLLLQDILVL